MLGPGKLYASVSLNHSETQPSPMSFVTTPPPSAVSLSYSSTSQTMLSNPTQATTQAFKVLFFLWIKQAQTYCNILCINRRWALNTVMVRHLVMFFLGQS